MPFSYTNFQKSPYRGRGKPPPTASPRSVASLPRFGTKLTNHDCTTVTGISKGHKGTCPRPLIGVKNFLKGGVGDWYMSRHITYPYHNGIQCARKWCFHTRIFNKKNSLPWEGGHPLHTPRFGPPLTNTGCTTVTGIYGAQGPMLPLNWSKGNLLKGNRDWYMPPHITIYRF